jgi:hypothetical protein
VHARSAIIRPGHEIGRTRGSATGTGANLRGHAEPGTLRGRPYPANPSCGGAWTARSLVGHRVIDLRAMRFARGTRCAAFAPLRMTGSRVEDGGVGWNGARAGSRQARRPYQIVACRDGFRQWCLRWAETSSASLSGLCMADGQQRLPRAWAAPDEPVLHMGIEGLGPPSWEHLERQEGFMAG